jgi:hypothetical protein
MTAEAIRKAMVYPPRTTSTFEVRDMRVKIAAKESVIRLAIVAAGARGWVQNLRGDPPVPVLVPPEREIRAP